jgi:capsular exopolysaccharide synthesis family protein
MDDRIRRIEDFETALGIPVLGMIPKVKLKTVPQRAMVAFNDQDSQVSEAFRGIYAGLSLDDIGQTAKVIMVVSAGAAEGKSFVSTNLAVVFAQNGKKTLLIDADLRRPTQHKLFEVGKHKGIPHLLKGEADWSDVVIHTVQPGLDLMIGRGVGKVNPANLLSSSTMEAFLKEARQRYDRVIVDCPPLFGVSDPLLILPKVDGSIFVSFYNKTHRRAVTEATQKLLDSKTPLLGAVINAVELSSHSYYYHRYGYNHYYSRRDDGAGV